jgi:hypothetical protein
LKVVKNSFILIPHPSATGKLLPGLDLFRAKRKKGSGLHGYRLFGFLVVP